MRLAHAGPPQSPRPKGYRSRTGLLAGNMVVSSLAVLKRWEEYFEKLMNEENNRDPRTEEAEVVKKR